MAEIEGMEIVIDGIKVSIAWLVICILFVIAVRWV